MITKHTEKRYKLKAKLIFYTSKKTVEEAKKALKQLEFDINKKLLTSSSEVAKLDIEKVERLPF